MTAGLAVDRIEITAEWTLLVNERRPKGCRAEASVSRRGPARETPMIRSFVARLLVLTALGGLVALSLGGCSRTFCPDPTDPCNYGAIELHNRSAQVVIAQICAEACRPLAGTETTPHGNIFKSFRIVRGATVVGDRYGGLQTLVGSHDRLVLFSRSGKQVGCIGFTFDKNRFFVVTIDRYQRLKPSADRTGIRLTAC